MVKVWSWILFHKRMSIAVGASLLALLTILNVRSTMNAIERVPIRRSDLSTAIYGSAQLRTDRAFDLKIGTSAKIIDIKPSVGNRVRRGQTIIAFDNLPSFQSPIDGVVTAIYFRNGETAFAQSTILSIVEPTDFYLEMSLDQKSVRSARKGQAARISFDGYRDIKIDGKVRETFSNNGLFFAIIDLDYVEPSFLPGMSADVSIITEVRKDVLLAPLSALKNGKILIEKRGIREVSVEVGADDGEFAEINGPLEPGDIAVIRTSVSGRGRGA